MAANERAAKRFRNTENVPEQDLYDSPSSEIVENESGDMSASNAALTPSQRAAVGAMRSAGGGGSKADVISGGLAATGNPYAIAAAAGIQVISASKKRKQRNQELKYQARLERISRQQRALESMTSVSQSLRNL